MGLFKKSFQALNTALDGYLEKSRANNTAYYDDGHKAVLVDPDYAGSEEQGYVEKQNYVSYEILRQVAMRDTVVASIIQYYVNQIGEFSRPQKDKYSVGFRIRLKDESKEATAKEKKECEELQEFFLNTGVMDDSRSLDTRDNFETYLRKVVRDSLIYDQLATELIFDNKETIHHFMAVSGGTIRFARLKGEKRKSRLERDRMVQRHSGEIKKKTPEENEEATYAQVYRGRIIELFNEDELIFRFRNAVTDLETNGYSIGELEMLLNVLVTHLHAENFNKRMFTDGYAQRGILHIKSDMPRQQLDRVRRDLANRAMGSHNAWRMMIVGGENDVSWINMTPTARDMEYEMFLKYLIRIITAMYSIDPMLINFDIIRESGGGQGASFRNEERVKISKSRGLKPMMRFLENVFNDEIMPRTKLGAEGKYEFRFVGLEAESRKEEMERFEKEGKLFRTINEMRAEYELDPIEADSIKGPGDFVSSNEFIQIFNAWSMQQQGGEQGGEEGGEEGEEQEFDYDALFGNSSDSAKEGEAEKDEKPPADKKKDE